MPTVIPTTLKTSTGITPRTLEQITRRLIETHQVALGEVKPIVENKLVEAGDSGLARLSAYVSNPEHSPDDSRLNIFLQSLPDSELRTELLYTSHFFIFRFIDKTKTFDEKDGGHVPLRFNHHIDSPPDKELPSEDELKKRLFISSNIKVDEDPHLTSEKFAAANYYSTMLRYIRTLPRESSY